MDKSEATLYRMAMEDHLCPFGLKAKDLLNRHGFAVTDVTLTSREAVDEFKAKHNVATTPQIFINDKRVGGFDDLQNHLGVSASSDSDVTYRPVIALFSVAALMSVSVTWLVRETLFVPQTVMWFIAIAMVLLGLQKLQDLEKFSTMFLNYDLLAQRWVRYGYVYPFIETLGGVLMLAGLLTPVVAPIVALVSTIGAVSVFKAVYIDKREIRCACLGDSRVPLGFVSLTENLMMLGMAMGMLLF